MPPSGYSRTQVQSLENFLASCFTALEREAEEKGLGHSQALAAEISDIEYELLKTEDEFSRAALLLTHAFYSKALALLGEHRDIGPDDARDISLNAMRQAVLGIHIVR